MRKFLLFLAVCTTAVACSRQPPSPPAESVPGAPRDAAEPHTPEAPNQPDAVVDAVDRIMLDVQAGPFNTQSGQLGADGLTNGGKAGYLLFGPYVAFQSGSYVATFVGQVEELPPESEVRLDISSDRGKSTHAVKAVRSEGDLPALEFTLTEPVGDLEVRIHTKGAAIVLVESYQVSRQQ